MDSTSIFSQFSTMNNVSEIEESLQFGLTMIENTDDWKEALATETSKKETKQTELLHGQILRSATRILRAEKEIQNTHNESSDNMRKLMDIETKIQEQKEAKQRIQEERSDEEKQAFIVFKDALKKARKEYEDAKRILSEKRKAKLRLVSAALERLHTLRLSHEELGRVYAKTAVDLEQKLQKERKFYTLNLDSLAKAQEEAAGTGKGEEDDDCSTTASESESTSGVSVSSNPAN